MKSKCLIFAKHNEIYFYAIDWLFTTITFQIYYREKIILRKFTVFHTRINYIYNKKDESY